MKHVGAIILGSLAVISGGLVYYFKKQADLIALFQYKILAITIDNFDPSLITGNVTILFTSISNIEITINEFYLDFYFDGNKVGFIQDVTPFIVPAASGSIAGSAQIPFAYSLNPQLVIGSTGDILSYTLKQKDAAISLRGYAAEQSGFIKATIPISYDTTVQKLLSS
jgi:hypothetical protein